MKVWISVHGRFHAFDLARELHRHGALGGVATTYPRFLARRLLPAGTQIRSVPWLEALRRFAGQRRVRRDIDLFIAETFARFSSTRFAGAADILVGWSGATLEAIAPARAAGLRVIIERGSTHILHQASVLAEEHDRFGLQPAPVDPRMIDRELAEYAAADAIAVPSRIAAASFELHGIPRDKILVNPYGANLSGLVAARRALRPGSTRILFVGGVGLRKGVPWLLRAFAWVRGNATLHIVGPLEAGMRPVLAREPLDRVVLRGPLRAAELERAYREADIFCLPSLEEGFPLALLRAMGSGLPVVCTRETGAEDAIVHGQEGFIVPARDPQALGDALGTLVEDSVRRHAMGEAARQRVSEGFSWSDYGARAMRAYERLLAAPRP